MSALRTPTPVPQHAALLMWEKSRSSWTDRREGFSVGGSFLRAADAPWGSSLLCSQHLRVENSAGSRKEPDHLNFLLIGQYGE